MSLLLVRNTIGSKRRLWHFLVVFILHEKRLTSHLLIFRELNRPYDLGIVDDPSLVYQIDLVNTREKNLIHVTRAYVRSQVRHITCIRMSRE